MFRVCSTAPHGRNGLVQLKVAVIVPHEAAYPVADLNSGAGQRVRQLVGAVPGLLEGLAVRSVRLHRDHFHFRVEQRSPAENAGHEKGCVLHCHWNRPQACLATVAQAA